MVQTAEKPIESEGKSIVDTVLEHIRDGIFHGRYAIGQRLIEADLTAEYRVSRSTIRAVLGRLEADGLVETPRNRGAVVRRLSRKALADTFDLRAALDGYCARLAAANIDHGDSRKRLKDAVKIWSRDVVLKDAQLHLEHNAAFHALLYEISDNQRLIDLVRQLQIPGYRIRFRLLLDGPRLARSAGDHIKIGNAVLAGDARKAEALAVAHTKWSGSLIQTLPDTDFSA